MSALDLAGKLRGPNHAPLICLDYVHYAERVFGTGAPDWFKPARLMNVLQQAQQGIRADTILFPLLTWIRAWNASTAMPAPNGMTPLKSFRAVCNHAPLIAALNETLQALGSACGTRATLALSIDDPADWLTWCGADDLAERGVDHGEAEDVATYLSALLHQMTLDPVSAVLMIQHSLSDADAGPAYESITNTAHHYGLCTVFCAPHATTVPEGFDVLANCTGAQQQGMLTNQSWWLQPVRLVTRPSFLIGTIPESATPGQVTDALECWRR